MQNLNSVVQVTCMISSLKSHDYFPRGSDRDFQDSPLHLQRPSHALSQSVARVTSWKLKTHLRREVHNIVFPSKVLRFLITKCKAILDIVLVLGH